MSYQFNEEDFDFLTEDEIDDITGMSDLLNLLRSLPDTYISVLDFRRYAEVTSAIARIIKFITDETDVHCIESYFDELLGTTLILSITTDIITISEVQEFCNALSVADTVEITPVSSGAFSVEITFQGVKKPL